MAEDIFEDSLLSLFQHHPIAFSTPSSSEPYIYHPPNRSPPIALHLPIAPSALHTTLQLTNIWLSSIFAADLIHTGKIEVQGRTVCELGAGAGLPGVAAARCSAAYVVGTDYDVREEASQTGKPTENGDPDVLDILRTNFVEALRETDCEEGKHWSVLGHTWSTDPTPLLSLLPTLSSGFSTLLLADLLWSSFSHLPLLASISSLLARYGVAHVISGLHQGRGAVNRFLALWEGEHGWVRKKGEVRWKWVDRERGEWSWEDMEEKEGEGEEERDRGVVVWYELGWNAGGGGGSRGQMEKTDPLRR